MNFKIFPLFVLKSKVLKIIIILYLLTQKCIKQNTLFAFCLHKCHFLFFLEPLLNRRLEHI